MRAETCLTFSLVCVKDKGTVLTYSENTFCVLCSQNIKAGLKLPVPAGIVSCQPGFPEQGAAVIPGVAAGPMA